MKRTDWAVAVVSALSTIESVYLMVTNHETLGSACALCLVGVLGGTYLWFSKS